MTMPDFIAATRQSIRPVQESANYVAGGSDIIRLPQVGLLARVHLLVSGTMTLVTGTGTHVLSEKGPWNLLNKATLTANQGTDIFRASGFGAHILDIITAGKLYEPDDGQRSSNFASALYNAPVANGANAWEFGLTLNITPNDRDMIGLILLQTNQMQAELRFDFATAGGLTHDFPVVLTGNATAAFVGTVTAHIETFTLPADPAAAPDIQTLYQTLEQADPIAGLGDQRINLLRANRYARIAHVVETNGRLDDSNPTRFKLSYNADTTPYDYTRAMILHQQRRRYSRDLPDGVYIHDLMYQGIPGYGGGRDLVDSTAVAELASLISIPAGTLGSGNNWVRTITQQFVRLQRPQGI